MLFRLSACGGEGATTVRPPQAPSSPSRSSSQQEPELLTARPVVPKVGLASGSCDDAEDDFQMITTLDDCKAVHTAHLKNVDFLPEKPRRTRIIPHACSLGFHTCARRSTPLSACFGYDWCTPSGNCNPTKLGVGGEKQRYKYCQSQLANIFGLEDDGTSQSNIEIITRTMLRLNDLRVVSFSPVRFS